MLVTVVAGLLVLVELLVLTHLVVLFFGPAATHSWGQAVSGLASHFVVPIGIGPLRTPYAGVFDLDAGATVLLVLFAGWVVGTFRRLMAL
jgi:hypothetical protein